ncbi:MAG TPA: N-acetylmuramoyl-L-alanine amidase [Flavobacterium sp.]|jgi:N-acetylmuramoyl-L-alanine amidase|nr:N-acetylmuramoyl-L-alanine amidase [Flavobacterium sp.]
MKTIFSIKIFFTLFLSLFVFTIHGQSTSKFKVALDAGHGGHDFGAVYNGHIEKNIALGIVLKVGAILEKNKNIDVIYTRKTDVFIELVERSNIANRADANIFVSIHCNANKNTEADGTESYVMGLNKNASNLAVAKNENSVITLEKDYKEKYEGFDPNNPSTMIGMTLMQEEYLENSISLASKVQDQFVSELERKNRGVKQAPFMVLHKAYMPRVLIETGFISNPKEGAFLDSEEGQMEMAQAIADAIISYKKEYFGLASNESYEEKPSKRVVETPKKDSLKTTKPTVKTEKEVVEKAVEPIAQNGQVIYKIQLAASSKKIDLTPQNFKGLNNISVSNDGGSLYKYMYGSTSDYNVAKQNLNEAKSKGYQSAYIIAFKNGQKIAVQDALKESN